MQGNVKEWCWDWYAKPYEPGEAIDPTGPKAGTERVMRGGHYRSSANSLRCACRDAANPAVAHDGMFGFRVARTYP